jgi:hypothetical protein
MLVAVEGVAMFKKDMVKKVAEIRIRTRMPCKMLLKNLFFQVIC